MTDEAAIQEILHAYARAHAARDSTGMLSLWAEDGMQMWANLRPSRKADFSDFIIAYYRDAKASPMRVQAQEIAVAGDWAFMHSHYSYTELSGAEPIEVDGKSLMILKRQLDGTWKIYRDCINSNLPE